MNGNQQIVGWLTVAMAAIEFWALWRVLDFWTAAILAFVTLFAGLFVVWQIGNTQRSNIDNNFIKTKICELSTKIGERKEISEDDLALLRNEILKGNREEKEVWGSHFNYILSVIKINTGKKPITAEIDIKRRGGKPATRIKAWRT